MEMEGTERKRKKQGRKEKEGNERKKKKWKEKG